MIDHRYILTKDTRFIYVPDSESRNKFKNIPVFPNMFNSFGEDNIYFLDILGEGTFDFTLRAKVYFPDGQVILGEVLRDYIKIFPIGDTTLLDGRFNS